MTARPTPAQLGLLLAQTWALRGTCARRRVGCVLMDVDGYELSSGYNGPEAGAKHCTDHPCAGAQAPSGTELGACAAIHAEQNALMRCADVRRIHACYVTCSPCVHCVKMLLNTGCHRIIFSERYAHDEAARAIWEGANRDWVHGGLSWTFKVRTAYWANVVATTLIEGELR